MWTNDHIANGRRWCIAGGWAACPQLATDEDVWIFVDDRTSSPLLEVRDDIWDACPEIVRDEAPLTETYLVETGFMSLKVGTLGLRHIILTDAANILDLLDGFDISTHQCAISDQGEFIRGRQWTPIDELPVVIRVGGPNTARRLQKIQARYNFLRKGW